MSSLLHILEELINNGCIYEVLLTIHLNDLHIVCINIVQNGCDECEIKGITH